MNWNKEKIISGVGAAGTAIGLAMLAFVPQLAGWVTLAISKLLVVVGVGFGSLSAWFFKASDEDYERAIWGIVLLVIIVACASLLGISLAAYWPLLAFFALIVAVAVLWTIYRRR